MEDSLLRLLFILFLAYGMACLVILALIGIGYAGYRFRSHIKRGLLPCGRFLAWRFSTKQMRKEVAAVYVIALLYAGAFLLGRFPSTGWEWFQFSVLGPWTWYSVLDDIHTYSSQLSSKPA